MKLKTRKECQDNALTKGWLAHHLYGHLTYDAALPQQMLDDIAKVTGQYIPTELVYWYPDGMVVGMVLPLTVEASELLIQYTMNSVKIEHQYISNSHWQPQMWKDAGLDDEDLDHAYEVVEEIIAGCEREATGD